MIDNKKVNAIIQARMGSTRLPGKILMKLGGVPILEHVIKRLKSVKYIDEVIVATSENGSDDVVEQFCNSLNVPCIRGSETNVLQRFGKATKDFPADIYIRATADNPMIDVNLINEMIAFFVKQGIQYTCYKYYPLGSGVEIFTGESLNQALKNATKEYELEHVTPYIYQTLLNGNVEYYCSKTDDSNLRMTIDTENDFAFAVELFKRLYESNPIFGIEEIKKLLEKEPQLREINHGVKQKALGE